MTSATPDAAEAASASTGLSRDAEALLDAVVALASDLGLAGTLQRLVSAAAELCDARAGALAVTSESGVLLELITAGDEEVAAVLPPTRRADDVAPGLGDVLHVPVLIRGRPFGHLYLAAPTPDDRFTDEDAERVRALADTAALVVDNARAYEVSERRRAFTEAGIRVNDALQPPVRLEDALAEIAQAAARVSGAWAAAVIRREGDAGGLDIPPGALEISAVAGPHARDVSALVEDIDPALVSAVDEVDLGIVPDVAGHLVLLLPLNAHLSTHGVLMLALGGRSRHLEAEETELLGAFADQTALALDRSQAISDRQELMLVTDRERIARDLHDLVIQRLFATGLHLQGTRRMIDDEEVRRRLDQSVRDLDVTISDIRTTIFNLQRPVGQSLRDEVRAVVKEYIPVLGFTPVVRTSGPVDTVVSGRLSDHLLAVLREALSNAMRHAEASGVVIELEARPGEVVLRVSDNGRGLGQRQRRRESGLRNARERAEQLGGSLTLVPVDPSGTCVEWRAPLSAA